MNDFVTLLLGGFLTLLTAWIGNKFPNTNNLFVLAVLSLIAGLVGFSAYYFLGGTTMWDYAQDIAIGGFAYAAAIYQIFVNLQKITNQTKAIKYN